MDIVGAFLDYPIPLKIILAAFVGFGSKLVIDWLRHKYTTKRNREQEEIRYKNALRVAALDKRLEVYAKFYELLTQGIRRASPHDTLDKFSSNIDETARELDNYLTENAVYLDPETSEKVREAIESASQIANASPVSNKDGMRKLDRELKEAKKAILNAVLLPIPNKEGE